MFRWTRLGAGLDQPLTALQCDGYEVARLHRKVGDDRWYAILGMHLDWRQRRERPCTSFEAGRAGMMMWAERHRERLEAHAAERDADRRIRQPWLRGAGDDPSP